MSFQPEKVPDFLANFDRMKEKIRNAPGNRLLELYRDKHDPSVFFTYSYWETEADLDAYRQSELFYDVWTYTKTMFNAKPEAWSVDRLLQLY